MSMRVVEVMATALFKMEGVKWFSYEKFTGSEIELDRWIMDKKKDPEFVKYQIEGILVEYDEVNTKFIWTWSAPIKKEN
jgi:hypothetical protein